MSREPIKHFSMKIINLEEFRKLPEGIIFCKCAPCYLGSPQIKGRTLDGDFVCASLTDNVYFERSSDELDAIYDDAIEKGAEFRLYFESFGRDGLYEKDQLFAIYDKLDITQFISALANSLKNY